MERNRFHNLLSEIGENTIVILSTHIVDDVKNLCNRLVILNSGQIILDGTPNGVIEDFQGKIWKKQLDKSDVEAAKAHFHVISTHVTDGKVEVRVFSENQPDTGYIPVESNLEDVYFSSITEKSPAHV